MRTHLASLFLGTLLISSATQAGWQDMLKQTIETGSLPAITNNPSAVSGLSSEQLNSGLKQALQQGIEKAIELLGKENGFLKDPAVFIPAPGLVKTITDNLRKMGQDQLVDQFELTMNRAAESSMQEALGIFSDAIKNMSIQDAQEIINGPDNAATEYFRNFSEQRLRKAMQPVIQSATNEAGVTSAYKNMTKTAGGYLSSFMNTSNMDLDTYITDKAMDGLFLKVAAEEKRIRENPAARTTELLKQVFSN